MEQSGVLNLNNPNHMFSLHVVFMARMSHSLHEFTEAFNHHKIRTANNWSPYQMWVNGMMHQDNPLVHGYLDEDPDSIELYGEDPDGRSPFEDSANNVEDSVSINNGEDLSRDISDHLDLLRTPDHKGIDIYQEVLGLVEQNIGGQNNT